MKSSIQSAFLAFLFLTVLLSGCGSPAAIQTTATAQPPTTLPTATPSPTPYFTALPSETTNPQPTTRPYRRGTGDIPTPIPTVEANGDENSNQVPLLGPRVQVGMGCALRAENLNPDLDGVVILAEIDTHAVVAAVYVRSNDSVAHAGIPSGTYQLFAAMGQDWDGWTGRFLTHANYFRFVQPVTLDPCPFSFSSSNYQRVDVTLNTAEGAASDTVPIAPDAIPRFTP